jgi:hypothetical protein
MAIYGTPTKATSLTELQEEVQKALLEERLHLYETWKKNDAYHICFTNQEGTRYFRADRISLPHSTSGMSFGGGSYWKITYGKILWDIKRAPMGDLCEYFWMRSNKIFGKSANGTIIPKRVDSKKEVIEIAKAIGILVM